MYIVLSRARVSFLPLYLLPLLWHVHVWCTHKMTEERLKAGKCSPYVQADLKELFSLLPVIIYLCVCVSLSVSLYTFVRDVLDLRITSVLPTK